jgi:hypothetical protein
MGCPVVFLCMNILGTVFLYFGYDSLKKGITGDSRTSNEGVWMTDVPDLVNGFLATRLGHLRLARIVRLVLTGRKAYVMRPKQCYRLDGNDPIGDQLEQLGYLGPPSSS